MRLLRFAVLSAFGVASAATVIVLAARVQPDPPDLLRTVTSARTALFDAAAARWLRSARDRADELAPLLAQLPEGPLGKAAERTIQLFLERRLADDGELDGFLVLDARGHVLLQVGRAGGPAVPADLEVAQAAARPSLMMLRSQPAGLLLAAAPVLRDGKLRGLLAGHLRASALRPIVEIWPSSLELTVVDAAGVHLGAPLAPELRALGSESAAGFARVAGRSAAWGPLQSARAVLVVTAPRAPWLPGWRTGYWLAVALILAAAALIALRRAR
jgi:hypothetical protein